MRPLAARLQSSPAARGSEDESAGQRLSAKPTSPSHRARAADLCKEPVGQEGEQRRLHLPSTSTRLHQRGARRRAGWFEVSPLWRLRALVCPQAPRHCGFLWTEANASAHNVELAEGVTYPLTKCHPCPVCTRGPTDG